MKKKFFLIIGFLVFITAGFSESIHWFTPGRPEIQTSFIIPASLKCDLQNEVLGLENYTSFDFKELYLDCGFSMQAEKFNFTTGVYYMPLFLEKFRLGIGLNYHLYRYFETFTENDIVPSIRFRWCRTDFFNLDFDCGFIYKIADIDAMHNYKSSLNDFSYFLELFMRWQFTPTFDFYFSLKSIDYFDYPLLGTPFFKTGFDYEFTEGAKLNIDLTLKFVDMITSAVYLSECILRTGVKVNF